MQLKRKMVWLILLAASLPIVWMLMLVDDWQRDWTTNFAQTNPGADDPRLRPLRSPHSPQTQADKLARWAESKSNWRIAAREQDARVGDLSGAVRIHLVRTTPLLRFRDDIHVTLTPTPDGGSILEATSQSRVGKGDLGQNPRNLNELIRAAAR